MKQTTSKQAAVYLTPEEYAAVQARAAAEGRTVSNWLRLQVLRAIQDTQD